MNKIIIPAIALGLAFTAIQAQQAELLPDPTLTPGAVRSTDRASICGRGTAYLRQDTEGLRAQVEARYHVPSTKGSELDHLIPLGIGGANAVENLWPQPWPEAHKKDRLEWRMRDMICREGHDIPSLQAEIARDWRKAYSDYMGGR